MAGAFTRDDFLGPIGTAAQYAPDMLPGLPDAGLGPMTATTQAGQPNAFLEAPTAQERPNDVMAPVAQTLADSIASGYGLGQEIGQTGMDLASGKYKDAGLGALSIAAGFTPLPGAPRGAGAFGKRHNAVGKPDLTEGLARARAKGIMKSDMQPAFHWTKREGEMFGPDNRFRDWTHFGTQDAAYERFLDESPFQGNRTSRAEIPLALEFMGEGQKGGGPWGSTYPVSIAMKNPLEVKDFGVNNPWELYVQALGRLSGEGLTRDEIAHFASQTHEPGPLMSAKTGLTGADLPWGTNMVGEQGVDWTKFQRWDPRENAHKPMGGMHTETGERKLIHPLRQMLDLTGYDGLSYKNDIEHKGSTSLIPTHKNTVRSRLTGELLYGGIPAGVGLGAYAMQPQGEEEKQY